MAGNGGGVSVGKGRHHRHKKIEYIQVHIMASKIKYMFLCCKRALSIGWQRLAELRIIRTHPSTRKEEAERRKGVFSYSLRTHSGISLLLHCYVSSYHIHILSPQLRIMILLLLTPNYTL